MNDLVLAAVTPIDTKFWVWLLIGITSFLLVAIISLVAYFAKNIMKQLKELQDTLNSGLTEVHKDMAGLSERISVYEAVSEQREMRLKNVEDILYKSFVKGEEETSRH